MSSNQTDDNNSSSLAARPWHALVRGKSKQMSERELVDHYREGRVFRSTMVWCDGMPEWLPLESVSELIEAIEPVEASSLLEQLLDDVAASSEPAAGDGASSGGRDSEIGFASKRRDTLRTDAQVGRSAPSLELLEAGEDENTDIDATFQHTPSTVMSVGAPLDPSPGDIGSRAAAVFDPARHTHGQPMAGGSVPPPFHGGEQRSRPPSRERLAAARKARRSASPESSEDDDEKTVVYNPNTHRTPGTGRGLVQPPTEPMTDDLAESEPPTLRPPGPGLQRPRASVPHLRIHARREPVASASEPAPEVSGARGMVTLPPHAPPRRSAEPAAPSVAASSVELHHSMRSENEHSKPSNSQTSPALRVLPAFRRVALGRGGAHDSDSPHPETLTGVRQALRDTQLRQRRSLVTVALGAAGAAAVVTAVILVRTENPVGRGGAPEPEGSTAERSKLSAPPFPGASALARTSTRDVPPEDAAPTAKESTTLPPSQSDALATDPEDRGRAALPPSHRVAPELTSDRASSTPAPSSSAVSVQQAEASQVVAAASVDESTTASVRMTKREEFLRELDSRTQPSATNRPPPRAAAQPSSSLGPPAPPVPTTEQERTVPKQRSQSDPGWNVKDPGF